MLYLQHETFDQANIPPGNPQNRGDSFFVRKIIRIRLDPMTPALLQKIARFSIGL
jgi:hypothetical protein